MQEENVIEQVAEVTNEVSKTEKGIMVGVTTAVVAGAGYGLYKFTQKIIIPNGKKVINFVKAKLSKKKVEKPVAETESKEETNKEN